MNAAILLRTMLVLAWAVGPALGAVRAGAGSFGSGAWPRETAHGWAVLEGVLRGKDAPRWLLVHVPPRRALAADGVMHGASDGELRQVRAFSEEPRAIGAWGQKVWIVFGGPSGEGSGDAAAGAGTDEADGGGGGGGVWRVRALRATPVPLGDFWTFEPAERLDPEPSLPGGGNLLGFAGSPTGPVALLEGAEGRTLLRLRRGAWEREGLPEEVASGGGGGLRLLAGPSGPLLVGRAGDELRVWAEGGAGWAERRIEAGGVPPEAALLAGSDGEVIAGAREGGALRLWTEAGGRMTPLTRVEGLPERVTLTRGGGGTPRLVIVCDEEGAREPEAGLGAERSPARTRRVPQRVIEVSEDTGLVLYDGGAQRAAPVTAGDFRLLAAALLSLMGAVLLVVLRPEGESGVVALPEGAALAPPGRRLAATVVDATLALLIGSALVGVPAGEALRLFTPAGAGGAWAALPASLLVGAVGGTLTEWGFGRTPGKLLLGMVVVSAVPGDGQPRRARLWQHAVRNGVKWLLPPVAALALLDPSGRHRGDQLARAVVVEPVEEEPGGTGEGDS